MQLKQKILSKKELNSIDPEIFEKIFEEEKELNQKLYKKIEEKNFNPKSKEFKEFVKIVRKRLREIYGVFFKEALSKEKRDKILRHLKESIETHNSEKERSLINNILASHLSTFERKNSYKAVYKKIFEITGKPKLILDLGCGYNPFSYAQLDFNPEYVASDISKENLDFIAEFAKLKNYPISTISADLTTQKDISKISDLSKKADITFVLKLLDSLEAQDKGISKKLIENIKSAFIVISFPTSSISGKTKILSKRKWFQNIVRDMQLSSFAAGDEEYFVLNKRI